MGVTSTKSYLGALLDCIYCLYFTAMDSGINSTLQTFKKLSTDMLKLTYQTTIPSYLAPPPFWDSYTGEKLATGLTLLGSPLKRLQTVQVLEFVCYGIRTVADREHILNAL